MPVATQTNEKKRIQTHTALERPQYRAGVPDSTNVLIPGWNGEFSPRKIRLACDAFFASRSLNRAEVIPVSRNIIINSSEWIG